MTIMIIVMTDIPVSLSLVDSAVLSISAIGSPVVVVVDVVVGPSKEIYAITSEAQTYRGRFCRSCDGSALK